MLNDTKEPFNHFSARAGVCVRRRPRPVQQAPQRRHPHQCRGSVRRGVDGLPRRHRGCPKFNPAQGQEVRGAQYKTETGKDLTFTLSHTADPDTTQDAVLVQQMLKPVRRHQHQLNPVADQSTLINEAIGKQFDATLWRNHPGADTDTQYVWWHCANSADGGRSNPNVARVRQRRSTSAGSTTRHQQGLRQGSRRDRPGDPHASSTRTSTSEFAKQLWNLWAQYTLWTIAYQPNGHGVLGPRPTRRRPARSRVLPPATRSRRSGAPAVSANGTRCHRM